MNNKVIVTLAAVVGVLFIALAVYYWITPSGAMPAFVPGYEPGSAVVSLKHGIASVIVGIFVLLFAWFKSAPSK